MPDFQPKTFESPMFTETSITESFEILDNHCKALVEALLDGIPPQGDALQFELIDDLLALPEAAGRIFLVDQGSIGLAQNGGPVLFYDSGDLIGLEDWGDAPANRLLAENQVSLIPFDRKTLLTTLTQTPERALQLTRYLMADIARRTLVATLREDPGEKTALGFDHFAAGQVIIQEGTQPDAVYSIVEGHAEVTVKGVRVGEVLQDEIFGALALLTHSPRTATVTATRNCMCLVVPYHQFETLIRTHPRTCISLLENMARQIVDLNTRVMEHTSG
ncbi:Transcriptional regulatory protein, Crp family [gamma proteobacterium HdN1]|nr:Transcriptional regulatory protein, Crp family [gamma proteobacterium HdN1]